MNNENEKEWQTERFYFSRDEEGNVIPLSEQDKEIMEDVLQTNDVNSTQNMPSIRDHADREADINDSKKTESVSKRTSVHFRLKSRPYFSFESRMIIAAVSVLLIFAVACLLILNTVRSNQGEVVTFQEKNAIDYKICLLTGECISEEEELVASSIHTVKGHFQYQADYSKAVPYDIEYYVKTYLKVYDSSKEGEILYKSEDILLDEMKALHVDNTFSIDTNVDVDYQKYYNQFLQLKYDQEEIKADLEVALYSKVKNDTKKLSSMFIPVKSSSYKVIKQVVPESKGSARITTDFWSSQTILNAILASVLVGFCLFILYKAVALMLKATNNRSEYQEKLLKILQEYDRIIVIARDGYKSNFMREVALVDTFEELLEIKQFLQKPIIYSKVNDVKSEFIVEDEEKIYKFVIKESDV